MDVHALDSFTWVELTRPSTADLDAISARFDLPRFAFEVGIRPNHRSRFQAFPGHVLLVLKPAHYLDDAEAVEIGQLAVLAAHDVIVTIDTAEETSFSALGPEAPSEPTEPGRGPLAAVLAIVDRIVHGYLEVLDALDDDVEQIEDQVFSPERGGHAERIYRLKREVLQFRRAAASLPDQLDELDDLDELPASMQVQLRELRARAARVADHLDHLDSLLNSALSAHQAQIGIQQNNDMRRISAWVAIVATPTALAAIYGMNFRSMPELQWRFGYPLTLVVMGTICAVLYRLFRRSGWL